MTLVWKEKMREELKSAAFFHVLPLSDPTTTSASLSRSSTCTLACTRCHSVPTGEMQFMLVVKHITTKRHLSEYVSIFFLFFPFLLLLRKYCKLSFFAHSKIFTILLW